MTATVAQPERPSALPVNVDGIAPELIPIRQWVGWSYVYREGKSKPWTKPPHSTINGGFADSMDPDTWGSFDDYRQRATEFDGPGFVFTRDDDYCGIDLDNCRNPATGAIDDWAQRIIDRFPTYTEISPSGTGVKIFIKGALPDGRRRKGNIELYDSGRYFTVTGHRLPGSPAEINDCHDELQALHREVFTEKKSDPPATAPTPPASQTDRDVIAKVTNGRNGDKWNRLFDGFTDGYPSHSEADQALCNRIAFFCGNDPQRVDSVFRQSGLMRPKWEEREDYRGMTISNAINSCTSFYQWNGQANNHQSDDTEPDQPKFRFYTASEFAALDLRRDYHIPGVLAAGPVPTVMAGAFKTMKTSIAVDLSLSLAMQHRFLGEFEIPRRVRVAIMSGESGGFALQNMAERISHSKGWTLRGAGDWWNICPELPTLTNPSDIGELEAFINERQIAVLIVDPTYLAMKDLDDAGNIFSMGAQLEPLVRMGERTGCTVVIVHHNTRASMRNIGEPAELADIAWSGFAEIAGQWILLARREKYEPDSDGEHKLWLTAGGRDGHSTLVAVDIAEGRQDSPQGRTWDVNVGKASAARAEAAEAAAEEQEERKAVKELRKAENDREKVKAALERKGPSTISDIAAAVKMNHHRTKTALFDLEEMGDAVPCEITKRNKQTYDGFRLSTQVHPDPPGPTPTDSDLSGCPTAEPLHPDNSPIGGCRSGDGVGADANDCEGE